MNVKTEKRNKEVIKNFRITESDAEILSSLAENESLSQSGYLRNLIRNQSRAFTLSSDEITFLKKEFANLTRLGSNLNQIVYHMNIRQNQGKEETSMPKDREEILALISSSNDKLNIVKKKIADLVSNYS